MKTASARIAPNARASQKWRVSGVPGSVHTTKSDSAKSRALRSAPPGPADESVSSASACGASDERSASTRMPSARQRGAVVVAMWPKPTKPTVRPRSCGITNLSHVWLCLLAWQRSARLVWCNIAHSTYSARDSLNAPRPLERRRRGCAGTVVARPAAAKKGASESTPAEKEWNQRTDGARRGHASTSSAGDAGGIQRRADGAGETASSSRAS
mmetsp:Transcript_13557/g.42444  ORF Transcript_13557/g.42444 Transcript_13557/m.42444 type:complete len:213 (+) Transcript_13557:926-1564(+)